MCRVYGASSNGVTYASWESQKEKREKEAERIFEELMIEIYPYLMKNINLYISKLDKL